MAGRWVDVGEAARELGISTDAVRKRITRGSLKSDRRNGNVLVWLDDSRTKAGREAQGEENEALVEVLQDQVAYLREQLNIRTEELREHRRLLAGVIERVPELQAPREPDRATELSKTSKTTTTESERAEPQSATVEAQEGTERLQQRSGWLAPVDKLPWWQYALGVILLCVAVYIVTVVEDVAPYAILNVIIVAAAWVLPGVFGLWVGLRQRNPRLWLHIIPFGALLGVAGAITVVISYVVEDGFYPDPFPFGLPLSRALTEVLVVRLVLPAWLLYVSGAVVGNAWQRRRIGRVSGTTPVSPIATTRRAAAQQPRKDLTPTQQAILGWGGSIIAALITVVGGFLFAPTG